nr:MAG TPA: hypothetical protein [Caudoviricetes sp.]
MVREDNSSATPTTEGWHQVRVPGWATKSQQTTQKTQKIREI